MINDRYVVDSVIGKGSSGTVYKATRLMMGGVVAIKVIDSYIGLDRASLDRLIRELKAAEKLRHPHIITVWESGTTDDGQPYLVMDYLEGVTLGDLLKEQGSLPPHRVLSIFKQICEALSHAHEQGLIHRDMKPENVVLEASERRDYAKVLDFGIADTPAESAQRARFQKPQTVAGSPAYMSPEQCQGFELDFRSDLYSMAVILFEMFTGRRPFVAPDLTKLMYKTVTEQPPLMKTVKPDVDFPMEVEAVVAKALSKNPNDRQPSIKQLVQELEAACELTDFGKKNSTRNVISVDNKPFEQHEFLPTERLLEPEPKKPKFAAGPEDMPELFMDSEEAKAPSAPQTKTPPPPSPSAPTAPPPPGPAGGPPRKSGPPPLPPTRAKAPPPPMPKPKSDSEPSPSAPVPSKVPPPSAAAKPAAPASPAAPARPAAPAAPAAPTRPAGPAASTSSNNQTNQASQIRPNPPKPASAAPATAPSSSAALPGNNAGAPVGSQSLGRLSALVKPTSEVKKPTAVASKPNPPETPKTEARPPSVYSYVPPKEKQIEAPLRPGPSAKDSSKPGAPRPQNSQAPRVMGKPASPGQRPAGAPAAQAPGSRPPGSPTASGTAPKAATDPAAKPGVKTIKKVIKKVKKVKRPESDLDGNMPTKLEKGSPGGGDKLSRVSWEDEVEALKTGNFEPTSIPVGDALQPDVKQSGQWPTGTPMQPGQMPQGQMPPYPYGQPYPAHPGYPPHPGPYPPGYPMPPQGYDPAQAQNMSWPPGQMPPQGMMPPQAGYPQMPPYMPPQGMVPPPGYPQMPGPYQQVPPQQMMPPGQTAPAPEPAAPPEQPADLPKKIESEPKPEPKSAPEPEPEPKAAVESKPKSQGLSSLLESAEVESKSESDLESDSGSESAKSAKPEKMSLSDLKKELEKVKKESGEFDSPAQGNVMEDYSSSLDSSGVSEVDKAKDGVVPSIPNPLDASDSLLGSSNESGFSGGSGGSAEKKIPSTGLGSLLSSMTEEADRLLSGEKDSVEKEFEEKSVNPLDLFSGGDDENSEFQTLDISKGQKVNFAAGKEKAKDDAPQALGDFLKSQSGAVSESGLKSRMPEATNPIASAVDDMFPDDTMGGGIGASSGSSQSKMPAATNEISDAVDKWLDTVAGGGEGNLLGGGIDDEPDEEKPQGISAAAAKLSAALSMNDEDDDAPGGAFSGAGQMDMQKTELSKSSVKASASTSTSDALSRLLEAASNAPESSTRSGAYQLSSSMVNEMMQDASGDRMGMDSGRGMDSGMGGGEANPRESLQSARGFSDASAIASSGRMPSMNPQGDKYGQDAVNARIAALNEKLDLNSSRLDNVELPSGMDPTPSVFSGGQRRDAVNRILEEAGAQGMSGPGEADMPQESYGMTSSTTSASMPTMPDSPYSLESLESISTNRLAHMAEAEAKSAKRSSSRLRSKQSGLGFDIKTPLLVVAVLGLVGFLGVSQGWFGSVGSMLSSITSGAGGGGKDAAAARDEEVLAEATELADKWQLSKARELLEKYNSEVGLTPKLESKLDEIYIAIAKYQAKKDNTAAAIKELKKIPKDSSHFDEAKELIDQYSSKKSSSSKSRRSKRRSKRR